MFSKGQRSRTLFSISPLWKSERTKQDIYLSGTTQDCPSQGQRDGLKKLPDNLL